MHYNKFRAIREKLGYTQVGMELALGITQSAVSQHERGATKPTIDVLKKYIKLCDKHGIKLDNKKVTLEMLTE